MMNQKDIDIYNEIKDNPIVQSYKKLLDEWVKEYESKDPKKEFYKEDNGISYFICLPYDKVGISAGKLVNVHHKYSAVGLDKEKPMKVVPFVNFWGYKGFQCPKCGKAINGGDYCPHCGKHLDWEGKK